MAVSTTTALASTTLVGAPFEKSCPSCGLPPDLTRRRIKDLEGQVHFLNSQACQMSEKLAEYEEEVQRLRAQNHTAAPSTFTPRNGSSISSTSTSSRGGHVHSHSNSNPTSNPNLQSPLQQQGRLSSLASLLPYRRTSTACSQPRTQTLQSPPPLQSQAQTQPSPPLPLTPRPSFEETLELQNALNREQSLRKAAESQLTEASTELEELTAQLFSQANEMVAQERKARARLEERVAVLERRDIEKRNRLDRLEKAMERVERIRALVG
ncbi:hypothetical protein BJX76DRAFT_317370 [Aspergillus varians]